MAVNFVNTEHGSCRVMPLLGLADLLLNTSNLQGYEEQNKFPPPHDLVICYDKKHQPFAQHSKKLRKQLTLFAH